MSLISKSLLLLPCQWNWHNHGKAKQNKTNPTPSLFFFLKHRELDSVIFWRTNWILTESTLPMELRPHQESAFTFAMPKPHASANELCLYNTQVIIILVFNTQQRSLGIKQFLQGHPRRLLPTWDGISDSYGLQVLCLDLV